VGTIRDIVSIYEFGHRTRMNDRVQCEEAGQRRTAYKEDNAGLAQWRSRCFRNGGVGRTCGPLMDLPNGGLVFQK